MSETKFTPGPWEISHQNGDPEEWFNGIIGPTQINGLGKTYRTYVAQYVEPKNASIIAAAPDLYEAGEPFEFAISQVDFERAGINDGDLINFIITIGDLRAFKAARVKARGEAV